MKTNAIQNLSMLNELIISDPVFDKKGKANGALDRFFLKLIHDQRDLVFVYLMIRLFCFVIPFTAYFYLAENILWWIAAAYLAINWSFFLGPYILMLHCTSHRRLFSPKNNWMNKIIPWILAPFFGESPETYYGHHMGMHHPENNLEEDLSSTMNYQRDSFKDFMIYFFRT